MSGMNAVPTAADISVWERDHTPTDGSTLAWPNPSTGANTDNTGGATYNSTNFPDGASFFGIGINRRTGSSDNNEEIWADKDANPENVFEAGQTV